MSVISPELEAIGRRIERLTLQPESISAPLTRLFRPILHRIGWRPKASLESIQALVAQLEWVRHTGGNVTDCRKLLRSATEELRDNLQQVERATVINRRPLVAHAAWLRRMYELVARAERAVSATGRGALFLAATPDEALMLPPMSMSKARPAALEEAKAERAKAEGEEPTDEDGPEPFADPSRVLELQLDTIDHLMAAAREEDALLGRRRRLLDTARQLLLETAAALALEEEGVQKRLQSIAQQITRINRYQAVGLLPDVAMMHQARTALSRGERDKLYAALSVLRRSAVDQGDLQTTTLLTEAIDRLTARASRCRSSTPARPRSAARPSEMFGDRVVDAVSDGLSPRPTATERDADDDDQHRSLGGAAGEATTSPRVKERRHAGPHRSRSTAASTWAGCCAPVRVEEQFVWQSRGALPHPAAAARARATGPQDIGTALVHDPRSIILDLAAGRLLARDAS